MSSWFWNIYQSVKARAVKLLKCQLQFTPKIPSWSSLILGSYILPRLWVTHPSGTPILFWLCSGLLTARNLTVEPHPRSHSLASCYFLLQKFSIRSSQAGYFCLFYFSFSITVPLLCSGELQEHLLQEQTCGNFYSLLCTGTCMYSMFYALGAQQSWHEMETSTVSAQSFLRGGKWAQTLLQLGSGADANQALCSSGESLNIHAADMNWAQWIHQGREYEGVSNPWWGHPPCHCEPSDMCLSGERGAMDFSPSMKSAFLSPPFLQRIIASRWMNWTLKPHSPCIFFPLHFAAAMSITRNKPSTV